MIFLKRLSPVKQLIVIVGSLAVLSLLAGMFFLPGYLEYMARGEQQDAVENLRVICKAELDYYQKNKRYTDSFSELGFTPSGSYTYYLGKSVINSGGGKAYPLPASVQTYVNDSGFKAVAVSNLDEDPDLDLWTVDEKGVITNVFNDFNKPRLQDYPQELRQLFKKK